MARRMQTNKYIVFFCYMYKLPTNMLQLRYDVRFSSFQAMPRTRGPTHPHVLHMHSPQGRRKCPILYYPTGMIPPSGGGIASPRGEKAYYIILPHRVDSPPQGGDPPQGEKEYYTILPHSGDYPPQGGNSPPQGEKVYHVVATDKITV